MRPHCWVASWLSAQHFLSRLTIKLTPIDDELTMTGYAVTSKQQKTNSQKDLLCRITPTCA